MAIDIDQVLEDLITGPKSVTNAAGETVVARSADEIVILLDRARRRPGRPPFAITTAIPPGAVGPNNSE